MALKFKKGDKVRLAIRVPAGVIVDQFITDDEVQYLMEYKREDGEIVRTQVKESEIVEDTVGQVSG